MSSYRNTIVRESRLTVEHSQGEEDIVFVNPDWNRCDNYRSRTSQKVFCRNWETWAHWRGAGAKSVEIFLSMRCLVSCKYEYSSFTLLWIDTIAVKQLKIYNTLDKRAAGSKQYLFFFLENLLLGTYRVLALTHSMNWYVIVYLDWIFSYLYIFDDRWDFWFLWRTAAF